MKFFYSFFFLLTACSTNADNFIVGSKNAEDCNVAGTCVFVGTLTRTNITQGDLYELQTSNSKMKICLVVEESINSKIENYSYEKVEVSGKMSPLLESPNCAFIKYGNSYIPCGYCGENILSITRIRMIEE